MKLLFPRASFHMAPGFTLIEMLTSMAVLAVISALLFAAFDQGTKAWLLGESRVETFGQARATLDFMAQELSQAIQSSNVYFRGTLHEVDFVAPLITDPVSNRADLCQVGYVYTSAPPLSYPTWMITRLFTAPTTANLAPGPWNIYGVTWWNNWDNAMSAVLASNCVLNLSFTYYDQNFPLPSGLLSTPYVSTNLPYVILISMDTIDTRTAAALAVLGGPSTPEGSALTNRTARTFSRAVFIPTRGN